MTIQMICPNVKCGHIHSFPDEARGQVIKCLKCDTNFRIPSARPPVDADQARANAAQLRVPAGPFVF